MTKVGDLEVSQDLRFQKRSWAVQRVGWTVMVVIALAAIAGLLGEGPLSTTTLRTEDGELTFRYNRIDRHRAPSAFLIGVTGPAVRGGKARVWLDRSFAEGMSIETIHPEPESVEVGAGRLTYTFAVSPNSNEAQITFEVLPQVVGATAAHVGIDDGPALAFRQLVLP